MITGEGGDIIIFDDPHNVRAIGASDVAREKTPTAREGGLFKREWISNPVKFAPEGLDLVRAWDFASSIQLTNDPDWTVGLLMGRDRATDLIYIIDVIRARLSPRTARAAR